MHPATRFLCIAALASLVTGCGVLSSKSDSAYTRSQTRQEMTVRTGVVDAIREVTMEGGKSGVGGMAGAVVGGVAGSNVGGGKGQIIGAVIGAVLGGMAGNAVEEETSKKKALEITVKLDSGKLIAVVQEGDIRDFRVGDPVRILSGNGETRVTR